MKTILSILFLLISVIINAETYYVSPRGADVNTGADTISTSAWLTWLKAFNTATAGDTVYFLGGNYLHPSVANNIGPVNSGTPSSFIYFMAYPNHIPTLDCSNKTRTGYSYALYMSGKSYIYFKGLHFKDNHQLATDHIAGGTNLYQCNYVVFEDCKSYSHGYTGFADGTCDSIFYVNCDSYSNYNANMSSYSGGGSDGFYSTGGSTGNLIKYTNCRAWFNSDDGWDSMYNNGLVVWEGCWSMGNGYDEGDGTGYKLGHISSCDGTLQRLLTRNISVNNKWSGFNENNNGRPSSRINCYNNMSYRDMYGFMNINSSDDTYERIYRNNIAYGFTTAATYRLTEPNITHDHNTWNGGVTVTDADFISLDTTQLYAVRQSNGSLPVITFGNLVSGSDLIDSGVDVGLSYAGTAPDIGVHESYRADYYVATWGNDAAAGTFEAPWLTWSKAFHTAQAGDTVYFRGGVYPATVTNGSGIIIDPRYPATLGYSGTVGNYICYFNYPDEVPILDCSNATATGLMNRALIVQFASYIHFKGLTIRNVYQKIPEKVVEAFYLRWNSTGRIIIENFTVHDVSGEAFSSSPEGTSEIYYINCDAYNCIDTVAANPGQYGTGFGTGGVTSTNTYVWFYGCRAWNCSDQGWAGRAWGHYKIENCWAFDNRGNYNGDGHGFKPSSPDIEQEVNPPIQRTLINNISANNIWSGFDSNDGGRPAARMLMYNNFSYHNGYGSNGSDAGTGFRILNASQNSLDRVLRNNLSYADEYAAVTAGATYTHSYNHWDLPITVTAADFINLDYTQLYGARQADHSLPDITFGRLASGSDLIDAGTNVGLPYDGLAPDLGFAEYIQAVTNKVITRPGYVIYHGTKKVVVR